MNGIKTNPETLIVERTQVLFAEHQENIFKHTDRLFAFLMILQWLGAIIAALCVSPRRWSGSMSQIHLHVWTALILGGVITLYPVFLALTQTGKAFTRHVVAVGQMLMSALLIHLTGGRIETHFHVFGSLAFLSFYRDWKVLIPATLVVALDHFIRGVYWPQSVFGVLTASPWRWVEHAGWVIFEDIFLVMASLRSVREMWNIAERTAELEASSRVIEAKKEKLETEIVERKRAEERLAKINQCFLGFEINSIENINRLTALLGELLGATCALYSHVDRGMLYTIGQWQAPQDFNAVDKPDGHICNDVIQKAGDQILVVRNLPETSYARTDPNVIPYKLQTYVGKAVKCRGTAVGSLCAVYQKDFVPSEPDEKLMGIIASAIGIEEDRKQAEEEIQGSEEKIRAFVETARDAIISADSNGKVISWNKGAEMVFGFSEAEAIGKPLTLIMPERFREAHQKGFARFLATREPHVIGQTIELSGLKKDGAEFPVEISLSTWTTKDGIFFTAILRDITERKRNEEALKGANRELVESQKRLVAAMSNLEKAHAELKATQSHLIEAERSQIVAQLAAGVAHEVKNPLGILLQGVNYVSKHVTYEDKYVPVLLDDMIQAIKRADYVVKGLLDLSRPSQFEMKPEDLNLIIENVLGLLRRQFDLKRIEMVKRFDLHLKKIPMDRGKIVSVLINLLTNAAEATPSGGTISITTEIQKLAERGPYVGRREEDLFKIGQEVAILKIEDTGTGIPESVLPNIFEPFFTTKRGKGGTGLGLSVVKNIVQVHRGTIEITNRKEGGAQVTVMLPVG